MSFPLLLCTNCEKQKEEDDDFLLLGLKNEKGLFKNNFSNSNALSFSDNNNNSTNNNLEIIEYPYSSENNQVEENNNDKIEEHVYQPVKTDFVKVKKQSLDYDDDLLDIKPPKLFTEPNKDETNDVPHLKTEPTNKFENNLYKDNNFSNFKHEGNNHVKMYSNTNSESLINNDNSIMNNKILLTNYYINLQNNKNLPENLDKMQTEHKKEIANDINIVNNINNITNCNNKIIGVKVDYPCPDTNSFYINNNNEKTSLKNNIEESNKKNEKIKENEINEKKLFLEKMKQKVVSKNYIKKSFNKLDKAKPKIKGKKSNFNVNIDIININLEKKKKNSFTNDNNFKKTRKKLTFSSLSNFDNRFNLRSKNSNDNLSTFFNQTENFQFQKTNNFLLKNILNKKINERKKVISKTFLEKRKIDNTISISKIANQTTINSTNPSINPFLKTYQPKKKKFKLFIIK